MKIKKLLLILAVVIFAGILNVPAKVEATNITSGTVTKAGKPTSSTYSAIKVLDGRKLKSIKNSENGSYEYQFIIEEFKTANFINSVKNYGPIKPSSEGYYAKISEFAGLTVEKAEKSHDIPLYLGIHITSPVENTAKMELISDLGIDLLGSGDGFNIAIKNNDGSYDLYLEIIHNDAGNWTTGAGINLIDSTLTLKSYKNKNDVDPVSTNTFKITLLNNPTETYKNLKYEANKTTKEAIITGVTNNNITKIEIPKKIDGCKVTEIGQFAFGDCKKLKSVEIPSSVTTIGKEAFYNCTSLKNIKIPDSVKTIEYYAFFNCSSLEKLTIPDSVTSIGNMAFENCKKLKSITLPKNLKAIDGYTFYGCKSLTNVEIPSKVKTIGTGAFENCTSLKQVRIPSSVTKIEDSVFSNCNSKLLLIVKKDSYAVKYAKKNKIKYDYDVMKKVTGVKNKTQDTTSITIKWNKVKKQQVTKYINMIHQKRNM